ncbi:UDP-glycosyltransferase 83A1-like [Panicum miliaceum]|uniref:UDP-glycosyltransferase 83A1-like n=1 Tax=Panicum miliaceum TaxID=4540 RepID=A0A3L6S0V7_PANMI|nr:UDP-glycosyltransferase 83A1-like [Panicum miliaceum]
MTPRPHALVIPYPAQGHVIPLLELAHALVDRGFTVTFVNSQFNHHRVLAAMTDTTTKNGLLDRIRLVAVPDGMEPGEDRNNLVRLTVLMPEHMAPRVEDLISRSHAGTDGPITCMVADYNVGMWALDIARRTRIKSAAIWPASAAVLASLLSIPKLIQDNIIDSKDGSALTQGTFKLSPDMPIMRPAHLAWNCIGDHQGQEALFRYLIGGVHAVDKCDFILCNSFLGAEEATFAQFPKVIPIGPLLTGERHSKAVGHFWRPEDDACILWLNSQPTRSVVYVAFGSFTMFDTRQFQELALGLELCGRPFLWVVRPDFVHGDVHDFPQGFLDRVSASGRGMMVAWSPQQRVLAHPAVACFVSHCGWNSTMEGVRNGVPFLAWPYFADQFVNQVYICDVWKVGLRAQADESGVMTKEHIASRVEELMSGASMRNRVEAMKKVALESLKEGGSSHDNFEMFVQAMKA